MANPTEIAEFTAGDEHPGWAITGPEQRIIVLTDRAFYTATYLTKSGFEQACHELTEGDDILNDLGTQKLGKRRHEVPFDAIDRLEAFDFAHELRIRYTVDGVTRFVTLRTPAADLYRDLFDRLHQRVAKHQDIVEEPGSAWRVSGGPLLAMLLTLAAGWFIYAVAADLEAGKEVKGGANPKGQLMMLLVTLVARALGPDGVIVASALIFALFLVWWMRRLSQRPQRSVVEVRPY